MASDSTLDTHATDEPLIKLDLWFGHVEVITTERREGNKIILGGYSISYDRDGKEVSRTEDTPNIVLTLPNEMCQPRPWWKLW